MKLITEKGQLPLPTDFKFTIEKTSPFFSQEGEQSIPIELPATAGAMAILNHPLRLVSHEKPIRVLPAKIEAGIFHRNGQLIFDSFSRSGISAALALSESDLYSQYSDKSIRDLFAEYIRDDYSASEDNVTSWANHIWECSAGSRQDDFTAFPVLVDKNENTYLILNEPDSSSTSTPWAFKFATRYINSDGDSEFVPLGYGVTPLLYLHRFIELLFIQMGYTIRANFFSSNSMLKKIVLLNNNADTICKGKIAYSDIVPSCSVSEFIDFVEKQFHCSFFIYPEKQIADIISMEDVLLSDFDMDISNKVDGDIKVSISDTSRIVLDMDKSLDGAAPPEESLSIFHQKYPVVASLDEEGFKDAYKYSVILRLSSGEYYINKMKMSSNDAKLERIGSNYFKYDRANTDTAEEFISPAVIPVMTHYEVADKIVIAPYIGDRGHRNTSYNSEKEDSDQKIIICFDAGIAGISDSHTAKYRLGTTQKYNNLGQIWGGANLTPDDFYTILWKKYNEVILNCSNQLTAKVDYSLSELIKFNLAKLKYYKGVRLLPKKISYSIGSNLECGDSEFLVIKEYSTALQDVAISFQSQVYKWNFGSEVYAILNNMDQRYGYTEFTWLDKSEVGNENFSYIPPPSGAELRSFHHSRRVEIRGYSEYSTLEYQEERDVDCYYESILIT